MATVYEKMVRNGNYKRIELGKVWPSKQRDTQKKKEKIPKFAFFLVFFLKLVHSATMTKRSYRVNLQNVDLQVE